RTRLKSKLSEQLEETLLEQGLRCSPSLREAKPGDMIRVFRAGSAFADLMDIVLRGNPRSDTQASAAVARINERSHLISKPSGSNTGCACGRCAALATATAL